MSDDLFRDGIINLHTRQFGRVVELIVQLLKDYQDSHRLDFDLFDPATSMNIEVKSSRVFKKQSLQFDLDHLYELIMNHSNRDRLLKQTQATSSEFDCNIQQVKIDLFDSLYYLLFFYDVIEIFRINNNQIKNDRNLNYSHKQHRGNKGEGQFHVNQSNYQYHKDHYFIQSLTYEQLKSMLLNRRTT